MKCALIESLVQDLDSRLPDEVIYENVRAVRPRNNANYQFAVPGLGERHLHHLVLLDAVPAWAVTF